jgi:hypothetical protein
MHCVYCIVCVQHGRGPPHDEQAYSTVSNTRITTWWARHFAAHKFAQKSSFDGIKPTHTFKTNWNKRRQAEGTWHISGCSVQECNNSAALCVSKFRNCAVKYVVNNLSKESPCSTFKTEAVNSCHVFRSQLTTLHAVVTLNKAILVYNRLWKPTRLSDVEAPTFSTQSAYR